jgi:hypothetical protein
MDKPIHLATNVRPDGAVTSLCFKRPRPISLRVATWTLEPKLVTCLKCLRILGGRYR